MQASQNGLANGNAPFVEQRAGAPVELDNLRAKSRRQAHVIDTLTGAVLTLRRGAAALKAGNAALRADNDRLHGRRRGGRNPSSTAAEPVEVRLALDAHAPAAARVAVKRALCDRVPSAVLDRAQLLVSELATNSVLHSGAMPDDELVLRVQSSKTTVRLEVEDCGGGDAVVARQPDRGGGGGFGLDLVRTLSERWGVEYAAAGGTRVWAQLSLRPLDRAVTAAS
jgi:anti-sigma regulatory factor (Ser/Thr protein kinase)